MHSAEYIFQALPELGETVLNLWRHFRIHFPLDKTGVFKLPELFCQHLLGYAGYSPLELRKPAGTPHELPEDEQFPFTAYQLYHQLYGTVVSFFIPCMSVLDRYNTCAIL